MRMRKPRIVFGKRGIHVCGPTLRIGGKKSGFNLSKSGLSYSTRVGKMSYNSRRGCSIPCLPLLLIASAVPFVWMVAQWM